MNSILLLFKIKSKNKKKTWHTKLFGKDIYIHIQNTINYFCF